MHAAAYQVGMQSKVKEGVQSCQDCSSTSANGSTYSDVLAR